MPGLLGAQEPGFVHHHMSAFPEEAAPLYVLRDEAVLRGASSTSASALLQLDAGTRLRLDSVVNDTLEMDGIRSCWLKVTAAGRTGYLWGGNVAQYAFGSTADPTVKFLAGVDHLRSRDATRAHELSYRLVALRSGKVLDQLVVRSFAWTFDVVHNLGNRGLHEVDDVISLGVPCWGGCGCTTGEVLVFWAGEHFHHAADLMGSPDGAYSSGTSFIFPADMEGEPKVIVRVTTEAGEEVRGNEADDEVPGAPAMLERIVRRERLAWNGGKLVRVGGMDVERYRIPIDP